jgi:precorrin-6A/cobalt-precorrin-6A reductase
MPYSIKDGNEPSDATPSTRSRVLLLGGTSEGFQLAARLSERQDLTVISSLAGRVSEPKLPPGLVRVGGFGGLDAMTSYLVSEGIRAVIDATHPYAVKISGNAEAACSRAGLPLIALARPPWEQVDGDCWHGVSDFQSAANFVNAKASRVFLSIGRQELRAFSECSDAWFLVRAIETPDYLPPHHKLILRRGPFEMEDELQLLRDHSIDSIVSKNSGGSATYTKIEAARALHIPVVMVERPFKHSIGVVHTVDDVIAKLNHLVQHEL